ncbi:MAG: DUF6734 family protein [bacterium]
MKYIHSMWSTPGKKDNFDNEFDKKYLIKNFYSYLFSALLVKKHGHTIELYCDENAYDLYSLIPYDNIHVIDLDNDGVDSKFWIYGKIKTHLLLNEPYIHIDGDVFLFNDVLKNFNDKYDLVVQSIENDKVLNKYFNVYYESSTPFVNMKNLNIDWFKYDLTAFNCGVIGFNDIDFKNKYAKQTKDLLVKLSSGVDFVDNRNKYAGMFLLAEQSLLYYLTKEYNKKYLEVLPYDEMKKRNFVNWTNIADEIGYCHMLGYSKYKEKVINAIITNINRDFPEYSNTLKKFKKKYL